MRFTFGGSALPLVSTMSGVMLLGAGVCVCVCIMCVVDVPHSGNIFDVV